MQKKYVRYIVLAAVFVLIMAGALIGYQALSERFAPGAADIEQSQELKKATDMELLDYDGNEVMLSAYFGKPIVVNLWATTCGPCRNELPAFEQAYKEYGDEVEFMMVDRINGVSETIDGVKQYVSDGGYTFPVYFDTYYENSGKGGIGGISSIPRTMFIDSEGNLRATHIGAVDYEQLSEYIEALLATEEE